MIEARGCSNLWLLLLGVRIEMGAGFDLTQSHRGLPRVGAADRQMGYFLGNCFEYC